MADKCCDKAIEECQELTAEETEKFKRQLAEWLLAERDAQIEGKQNEKKMPPARISRKGRRKMLGSKLLGLLRKK